MPDPTFATISSSQVPDLLNLSPWGSRLTLYRQFERREWEDRKLNARMRIGKLFEPYIVELVADRLALEVVHNGEAVYHRHPELPLGCTADATVLCPTRGFGVIETKAVDKYEFARSWTEKSAPKMYEVQHQEQLMVPHPVHGMPTWGLIAPYIYNDDRLELYERRPIQAAQERIATEAKAFFADLAEGKVPPAFGIAVELGILAEQFPEVDELKVIDQEENTEMAEFVRLYAWTEERAKSYTRAAAEMKPKLVQFMGDAAMAKLAEGVRVKIKKPQMAGQVVMLPAEMRRRLGFLGEWLNGSAAIKESLPPEILAVAKDAAEWCQIMRMPGVQNRVAISEVEVERTTDDALSNLEAG